MSIQDENVRIVQQLYAAFGHRDIPALVALLDAEVEWSEPANPYNPCGGTRRGHDGFFEWLRIGRDVEDILQLDPQRMLTDHDAVAVYGHMKCLAKTTGKTYESDFVHVVVIRAGKIVKFQEFFDTYVAGEAFRP